MKRNTNNTSIITASRISGWLPLVACAAMLILAGCTADDTPPADGSSNTPVDFTARVQTTPATRTAIGDNGQTIWADGDAVSVFMLEAGEAMPDGILTGADNVKYNVAPTTGALSPAGTPLFYPLTGKVDFIALYPYSDKGAENGKITDEYKYPISVTDQSQPEAIDVLYAKATEQEKSQNPVALAFRHVLSKIKLDIKPDNGMTDLTADQITAVTLTGMPASATLALQDGTLTPGTTGSISAVKEAEPSPGAIATFTALVPPQAANSYDRNVVVTVNGEEFTGTIPATDAYASNEIWTYPVMVLKKDIVVGEPEITPWETNGHDTDNAEFIYTVSFDANGGSGTAPAPQEAPASEGTVLPDGKGLTSPNDGKVFAGWSTTADYSGDFYRAGDKFITESNVTLYAVWSGDGSSEENPFFVFDAKGLKAMSGEPEGHYILMKDVTVKDWNAAWEFSGTFNGQGHTVTINTTANGQSGSLFGWGNACRIRQLCVAGNIENYQQRPWVGGIIGKADNGCVIENCLVTANISASFTSTRLGGIVGNGDNVFVRNCLVHGNIKNGDKSRGYVGGIMARGSGEIVNCVVLSEWLSIASPISQLYRIGPMGTLNNYGNVDMEAIVNGIPQPWNSHLNGNNGESCEPQPALAWWTNSKNWKTDGGFAAWDFDNIWEMGDDGYPRLRIVHP